VIFATGYTQGNIFILRLKFLIVFFIIIIIEIEFPFFDKETIERMQIPHYSQSGRVMDAPFRLYKGVVPIKGINKIK
jgi:hypothetical protein